MPGTDSLRIWYGRVPPAWLYVLPGAVGTVAVVDRTWVPVAWTALTFGQVWLPRHGATRLTDDGIETGLLRRHRVPWSDVRSVRVSPEAPRRAVAVLADGTAVPLRGVEWRAPRPPAGAAHGSAQQVVDWARAHGHEVTLDAA
ncbi:MAG TPA: PH domain-containing protein [Mycobacteriales bacterium]|jgi:hypothetical protein